MASITGRVKRLEEIKRKIVPSSVVIFVDYKDKDNLEECKERYRRQGITPIFFIGEDAILD